MTHNLPSFDKTLFIGREDEKKSLLEKLSFDCPDTTITISGITGVGKSSLVLWAAYECLNKFDNIVFSSAKRRKLSVQGPINVDGKPLKTLEDLCDNITKVFGLNVIQHISLEEYRKRVLEKTRDNKSKALFIIDNLEELHDMDKDEIHKFLNEIKNCGQTKIVVTDITSSNGGICLRELLEEDRLQMIRNLLPNSDSEFKQELSQLCRGIPLAIEYAADLFNERKVSQELIIQKLKDPNGDLLKYCFEFIVEKIHEDNIASFMLLMAISISSEGLTKDHLFYIASINNFPQQDQEHAFKLITTLIYQAEDFYTVVPLTRVYLSSILESIEEGKFREKVHNLFIQCYTNFAKKHAGNSVRDYYNSFDKIKKEWKNFSDVLDLCQTYNRYEDAKILWRELIDFTNLYGYWGSQILQSQWLINEALNKDKIELEFVAEVEANLAWILILKGGAENLNIAKEGLHKSWQTCEEDACNVDIRTNIAVDLLSLYVRISDFNKATSWEQECRKLVDRQTLHYDNNDQEKKAFLRYLIYAGDMYSKQGKFKEAKTKYEEARKLSKDSQWMRFEVKAAERLAHLYIHENRNLHNAEQLLNTYYKEEKFNYRRQAFFERDYSELMLIKRRNDQARIFAMSASEKFQDLGMIDRVKQMKKLILEIDQHQENIYHPSSTEKINSETAKISRETIKVIILSSPEDDSYQERIIVSLAQLERDELINIWTYKDILAGKERNECIEANLKKAELILLIISSDFLASDENYVQRVEACKSKVAHVVPVLVRASEWEQSSLKSLKPLPQNSEPVANWENKDEAFKDIAQGIRQICESIIASC